MKNEIRLALMYLAAAGAAAPAFAQDASPQCVAKNFDAARNAFTIKNAPATAVNQQCFLTVFAKGTAPAPSLQNPAPLFVEGRYIIELSGGGGGGGGGASKDKGGGGGGAGAAPSRTVQYLAPGVYKLTIGTGGDGGRANGGLTGDGNPTSLTNASTGQLIAGFPGADSWRQQTSGGSSASGKGGGGGGVAAAGGSSGGNGGGSSSTPGHEPAARAGGSSQTAGYAGKPGQAGSEGDHKFMRDDDPNAGGGGGAGVGSGGVGESANSNSAAGAGDLGGGGGGGRGGKNTANDGADGGNGFIRLTMADPQPQVVAAAPEAVQAAKMEPAAEDTRPAKRDRN